MVDIEQVRQVQEQRVLPVLKAWYDAKEDLEKAIETAKVREEEFHNVSDDVRRNIEALDLVSSMARQLNAPTSAPAPRNFEVEGNRPVLVSPPALETPHEESQVPTENEEVQTTSRGFLGLVRKSSRPLFPNAQRRA